MAGRRPDVSDEEILEIFRQTSDPVLSTSEVADELGYSTQGTAARLHELANEERLETKMVGNSRAWWLAD